jgi:hypothetical protein
MWCIPKLTPEFISRMEDILELYAKPYDPKEPVLCVDEKSKQLLADKRPVKNQTKTGTLRHRDYEYIRSGTKNIFVTIEPKGGYREVTVTDRRTKPDFANEIRRITDIRRYQNAEKIHLVLDNLNTHFETSFTETFSKEEAERILSRIQFHYTPKHASWLNMAEIEIGILSRQCIRGRIPTAEKLTAHLSTWQTRRNGCSAKIHWKFTVKDARKKFQYIGSKSD